MIITKRFFRISFFRGRTDTPTFLNENGGAVISTIFDKYSYANVKYFLQFMTYMTEIVYSKIEYVNDLSAIAYTAKGNDGKIETYVKNLIKYNK